MSSMRWLALVLALLAGPARAGDAVGVEIVQYGLYRADIVGLQPGLDGVMHNVVDRICHVATTLSVPMKIGVHFGIRYKVTGPVAGQRVILRKAILFPTALAQPETGRPASLVSNVVELKVGTTTYTEYALEQPWELVSGTWTFQFFERDRKLAEFSFTVGKDASVPRPGEPTCFQLSS